MRAWRLHELTGPGAISLDEVGDPEPGEGQVRVGLRISALNHLDVWVTRGLPAPPGLPHILGGDGAGVVDAIGPGVTGLTVGDEVIVNPSLSCGACPVCATGETVYCPTFGVLGEHRHGTLAEKVVIPAANAWPKPPALSWETAGSFSLATGTAFRMLRRARLAEGETLLVVGVGGGVSSAAALLGVSLGARVFVTSRGPEKIAWAIENGAEGGFDSTGQFSKELRAAAGGLAHTVVENVGPATWGQSLRSLGLGGRMVVCGATSGAKAEIGIPALFFRQLEIIGSTMYTPAEYRDLLDLIASGRATPPPVDRVFPFEELPAAMARMEAGRQLGKIALSVD
ncbi:MAG: zinc-binding dehydrogenase [Acidimicrobiia bacterium]|nr:zinc-binding dehydrogenase [bacterium]MXX01869.1 zinc-binding dehydrogenase [Acidimicrobiia bacterium]MDE0674150.1 zinc-binding dehydrogenase [bacterium]MXY75361.1 zinc-binding dehydrogenase [Acidimicrobiia bacterium]MYB78561.1 zinc-binding dehydrogenase [Acidimicrobiia bacterium]